MRGLLIILMAAAVAAAPAAANPEPGGEAFFVAFFAPIIIVGGAAAGFVIYELCTAGKQPVFVGEDVTIKLEPGRAHVAGVYRFHNAHKKTHTLKLRYPFPRGRDLGEPANVVIGDGAGAPLPFTWKYRDAAFEITVPPEGDAAVTVTFEQEYRGAEYTYILTSTRKWHRPIDDARFAVEAPAEFAPLACPYAWQEVPAAAGRVRYEFRREGFYPDVDLRIHWKQADAPAAAALSTPPVLTP